MIFLFLKIIFDLDGFYVVCFKDLLFFLVFFWYIYYFGMMRVLDLWFFMGYDFEFNEFILMYDKMEVVILD